MKKMSLFVLLTIILNVVVTILVGCTISNHVILKIDYLANADSTFTVSARPVNVINPNKLSDEFTLVFFSADATNLAQPYDENVYLLQYQVDDVVTGWKGETTFSHLPMTANQVMCSKGTPSRMSYPDVSLTPLVILDPKPDTTYSMYVICQ